jgi:hypothetical protein
MSSGGFTPPLVIERFGDWAIERGVITNYELQITSYEWLRGSGFWFRGLRSKISDLKWPRCAGSRLGRCMRGSCRALAKGHEFIPGVPGFAKRREFIPAAGFLRKGTTSVVPRKSPL